jgi:hypothetical protein
LIKNNKHQPKKFLAPIEPSLTKTPEPSKTKIPELSLTKIYESPVHTPKDSTKEIGNIFTKSINSPI